MTEHTEREVPELAKELVEIGRLADEDNVDTTLGRLVNRVCASVPRCQGAAISVLTDGTPQVLARRCWTAADIPEPSREVLAAQLDTPSGPLHETLMYGEPRRIADLAADDRWPVFCAAAITAGYRSCLFLPLPDSASTPAAFSLFSTTPGAFRSTPYDVVLLFALHAGDALDHEMRYEISLQLIEHLQTALGNRSVVGLAQDILRRRYDIASDVALDLLERCAHDANAKLSTVSLDLVDAQTMGTLPQTVQLYGLPGRSAGSTANTRRPAPAAGLRPG